MTHTTNDAPVTVEQLKALFEGVEAGKFDALDAAADQWIESAGIIRMCNAIASVFEAHAPQDIMDRFRAKLAAMMHLAFVEGAANGVLNARPALAALASAPAPRSRISATVADLKHALASAPAGDKIAEALAWYGEQARLCRLIHSEGDAGRHALSEDGGKRAAEALASAPACPASPDHADIMETIANAGDDWQKQGYATALAEVRDMANVGRSLLERIADHSREGPLKGWHPADCPTEVVCDLLNMLADASAPAGDGVEEAARAIYEEDRITVTACAFDDLRPFDQDRYLRYARAAALARPRAAVGEREA